MLGTWLKGSRGQTVWDGYLYKEGDEYVDITGGWVPGYSYYEGSQSKQPTHLLLIAHGGSAGTLYYTGQRTYVINNTIDITEYSSLKVDWESTGYIGTQNRTHLVVSDNKTDSCDVYTARLYFEANFSRRINTLDISGLSGSYYIRAHKSMYLQDYYPQLKVYNVWLE